MSNGRYMDVSHVISGGKARYLSLGTQQPRSFRITLLFSHSPVICPVVWSWSIRRVPDSVNGRTFSAIDGDSERRVGGSRQFEFVSRDVPWL